MLVRRLIFLLFLLLPLTQAADLPFVFGEETPPLEGLSSQELQQLAASAPGQDEMPKVSTVSEDKVMDWTEVGGKTGGPMEACSIQAAHSF